MTATAYEKWTCPPHADARRNFWLCVGNGAVVTMGQAFFAWDTVLAGLAFMLTRSEVLVGLLVSVAAVGWQWPQLFVGSRIEHVQRKMPVYGASAAARTAALAAMLVSVLLCHAWPLPLYWLILLWTAVLTSAGGVCVIPFMDIVAKTVPAERRPMLFAYRRLFGGLLGFLAGVITVYVLSPRSGLAYPNNYAVLLVAGLVFCAVAYGLFMATREPSGPVTPERLPFLTFIRQGAGLIRKDRDFRLYFLFRVCLSLTMMSQVLFVPFVIERLDAPLKSTGWFAATVALVMGLSSLVWGRVSQRHGEAALFRAGTGLLLLAPASGLAVVLLMRYPSAAAWLHTYHVLVYLVIFGCQTAGRNATDIGGTVYMLALPPPERRPTYFAFMNTLSAPLTFMPVFAGLLAARVSYSAAFGVSCAAGVAAFAVAGLLRRQG